METRSKKREFLEGGSNAKEYLLKPVTSLPARYNALTKEDKALKVEIKRHFKNKRKYTYRYCRKAFNLNRNNMGALGELGKNWRVTELLCISW